MDNKPPLQPQGALAPQQALYLAKSFLSTAQLTEDPIIKSSLCSFIETTFSRVSDLAKEELLLSTVADDQNLCTEIGAVFEERGTILSQLRDLDNAQLSFNTATQWRGTREKDTIGTLVDQTLSGKYQELVPTTSHALSIASSLESSLQAFKLQRLGDYTHAIYIPPMAKPSLEAPDIDIFPLMDNVKDFLTGDKQVMLILGDSGTGKSTFNRHLEHVLWQEYNIGDRIPLFINLPALERPDKELIVEQLRNLDFSDDQIHELKRHHQFTLICDGYDESRLNVSLHTTNLFNQPGQWNTKLIITCRTQYVGPDYINLFMPERKGHYHLHANFQQAVIAPFSKDQIVMYVDKFVSHEPRPWVTEDYMQMLTTIPGLMDLVMNPFLLMLTLKALPGLTKGRQELSSIRISRIQLYDRFVEMWSGVNKRRLENSVFAQNEREILDHMIDIGFIFLSVNYSKRLARAIFENIGGNPVVQYIHRVHMNTWRAEFFGPELEARLLQESSPLIRTGSQFRFIHRSMLEYFFSLTVFDPTTYRDVFDPTTYRDGEEFDPQSNFGSSDVQPLDPNGPLFMQYLIEEPSIIQFLCERVRQSPKFENQLRDVIELSKSDTSAATAAANAITILVRAGTLFHGADLQGIRIPKADLSGGQFDSAQLQGADLRGVNLTRSWLRQANLTHTQLEGVQFGELPYLQEESTIESCTYSPDGNTFAVGLGNSDIHIYNTLTWTRTCTFHGHKGAVTGLAFSPSCRQLLAGSRGGTLRLWSMDTAGAYLILEGHTDEIRAVAFSPSGRQVASVSNDMSARLWDPTTGAYMFVFSGHVGVMTSVAYSPDDKSIAFGSDKGTIRIFDTQTGVLALVLDCGVAEGIYSLVYSPDGQSIVSGNNEGGLQLWKARSGELGPKWRGHSGIVSWIDFSPDSQWIASSDVDGAVKLWRAQDRTLISSLLGHSGSVGGVRFSPDGSYLASCSRDNTLRLWELRSTPLSSVAPLSRRHLNVGSYGYRMEVVDVMRKKWLVSGSFDMTARVWDVETGELRLVCSGHTNGISGVAVSPIEDRFATGSRDGTVRLWSAMNGKTEYLLRGHLGSVSCVTFSPDGRQVSSGGHDGTVRLWSAKNGEPGLVLTDQGYFVCGVAFSPNGKLVGSASEDGSICLWDRFTGDLLLTIPGHEGSVNCIAFSPLDGQLASVGEDSTIRLWNTTSGASVDVLQGHPEIVTSVAYSPAGLNLVSGSWDEAMRVWDSERGVVKSIVFGHASAISSVAYSPCGGQIASGSWDGTVKLWDPDSNAPSHVFQGHTGRVTSVAYSNGYRGETELVQRGAAAKKGDGPIIQYIATIHDDNTIQLWDVVTGAPGAVLSGHTDNITCTTFSPDGSQLASSSYDGTVCLWTVPDGARVHETRLLGDVCYVTNVSFSPDVCQMLVTGSDWSLRLWDSRTGELITVMHKGTGIISSPVFSPDCQIAAANSEFEIHIWDAKGTPGMILHGHTDGISSLVFSPNGQFLASAGKDRTVRLWSMGTGKSLFILKGHTEAVTSIIFSPDSRYVASGSADHTMRTWDCTSEEPLQILEGHNSAICSLAYSPDIQFIASSSEDLTMRLWDANTGRCLARVDAFLAEVASITWVAPRLLHTIGVDNVAHVWRVVKGIDGEIKVQLSWRSEDGGLWMSGATFSGAVGISSPYLALLHQRGAIVA